MAETANPLSTPERLVGVLISWFACSLFSVFAAGLFMMLQSGFGAGDLWAFILWTAFFAFGVAWVGELASGVCRGRGTTLRIVLALTAGVTLAVLWVVVVGVFLGPWVRAFSFPILPSWISGGFAGILVSASQGGQRPIRRQKWVYLALIGGLGLAVGATQLYIYYFTPRQTLTVVVGQLLARSDGHASNASDLSEWLSEEDWEAIERLGLSGELGMTSVSRHRSWKPSTQIIVMTQRIDGEIVLPQPDGGRLIYFQVGNDWKKFPPGGAVSKLGVILRPDSQRGTRTEVRVMEISGALTGHFGPTWD